MDLDNICYRSKKYNYSNSSDLICQIIDWKTNKDLEQLVSDDSDENFQYDIHLFGITKNKQSVHIKVVDFKPYFYVEIPEQWNSYNIQSFISKVKDLLKQSGKESFIDGLITYKVVKRYKFYGFTNNELFPFLCLIFNSREAFNAFKYIISKPIKIMSISNYAKRYQLYEANIDPILRFIHMRDLETCGWIKIPSNKIMINQNAISSCQIDITCKW